MILCSCEAVSDRQVWQAVEDGAQTVRDVMHRTGAGRQCGSCVCDVRSILRCHQRPQCASGARRSGWPESAESQNDAMAQAAK